MLRRAGDGGNRIAQPRALIEIVEERLDEVAPIVFGSVSLADIAADPTAGSVTARETSPVVGLPANMGDKAPVRNERSVVCGVVNSA